MTALRHLAMSLSLAGLLFVPAPDAARADEPAVVKTLLDGYALNLQARPTYDSVETGADGTITIKGFAFGLPEGMAFQYDIESITLKGVSAVGDKGFEIASADYAGMTLKLAGQTVASIPAIDMTGMYVRTVPANPTEFQKTIAASSLARETTIPEVDIVFADKKVRIEDIRASFEGDPWAYNGTQHLTIGRLVVPDDIIAMAGDEVPLKQLGYTALEFSSDSTVKVNFTPDNLSFAFDMGLPGKDMGTLRISANVADIPFALVEAAQQGKENEDPDKLLALANGITVSNLSVGFADASLTNRLLDFFAAAQNMDRAQVIATAAASVQVGLIELKDQDFTNKVIEAVSTFLTSPGSLRVLAAAAPVKVEQFTQAGDNPGALMKLLQVDVQANQ